MNTGNSSVIVRIKGGLGNQLFCYAAARRLAFMNDAQLILDDVTGFVRERKYRRQYMLDHFAIRARKATLAERLEPFERYRRGIMKWQSARKPFEKRRYLEQEGRDFDKRLLTLKVTGTLYLDGYWQSEDYFKDIADIIHEDLKIITPVDTLNKRLAEEICDSQSVALHVRWFDTQGNSSTNNVGVDYYLQAIALIEQKIKSPHYFLFSDNPEEAQKKLSLSEYRVTNILHNRGDEQAYADLWLMSQCRHFIIANSTFSWWGAWLSVADSKIVIAPAAKLRLTKGLPLWGFKGQVPEQWLII